MKLAGIISSLTFCASFSTTSFGQFAALPPPTAVLGVNLQSIGLNAGNFHWDDPAGLGGYRLADDLFADPILPYTTDSRGRNWSTHAPASLDAARSLLNNAGGILRVIYVGESSGVLNDFGFTLSGNPSGPESYTLLKDIQSIGPSANVQFGEYFDIPVLAGAFGQFDFWYNSGINAEGFVPDPKPGLFEVFRLWGEPSHADQFIWITEPIVASTHIAGLNSYSLFDTYLVGVEDWDVSGRSDQDFSDFRFGLQFLNAEATGSVIPEPASFSVVLGLAVLLLLASRRHRIENTHDKLKEIG